MPAENMDSAKIIPGWDGLITYNLLARVLAMIADNLAFEGCWKTPASLMILSQIKK